MRRRVVPAPNGQGDGAAHWAHWACAACATDLQRAAAAVWVCTWGITEMRLAWGNVSLPAGMVQQEMSRRALVCFRVHRGVQGCEQHVFDVKFAAGSQLHLLWHLS